MDTLLILHHFEGHFGAQRDEVLELQRLGCQFGGCFEVSRGHMGCEGFFENLRSQSVLLLGGYIVFTLFFSQYNVALVNIND